MPRLRRGKPGVGQESLFEDGPYAAKKLTISKEYDLKRAKAAAKRRNQRLAQTAFAKTRVKGFQQRTGGLWVPTSGTENTAVVAIPGTKVRHHRYHAKQRVFEKYEDSDVPEKKVKLWAAFSARNAAEDLFQRYRTFMFSSGVDAMHIHSATYRHHGEIRRDAIENLENKDGIRVAYNAVRRYVIYQNIFLTDDPGQLQKSGQPKWAREDHKHKYAAHVLHADNILRAADDHAFSEWVDEAYWNDYSRHEFWKTEYNNQFNIRVQYGYTEDPNTVAPIEAYAGEYY